MTTSVARYSIQTKRIDGSESMFSSYVFALCIRKARKRRERSELYEMAEQNLDVVEGTK